MRIPRTRTAALAAALAALAVSAPAGAQTLSGTVVHHNGRAHSFVIAGHGGSMRAMHAAKLPAIGRGVSVSAHALSNGTFAAEHVHRGRHHARTLLHGTVSFVDRDAGQLTLSSNGVSLLLRISHGHGGRHATLPAVGTTVNVEAVLPRHGIPIAKRIIQVGTTSTAVIEGKLLAVDATARTLTLSADDNGQTSSQLTIAVPASIDLTKLTVGREVELLVTINADGTYTLAGLAGDDNGHEADDAEHQQGRPCGGHRDDHGQGDDGAAHHRHGGDDPSGDDHGDSGHRGSGDDGSDD